MPERDPAEYRPQPPSSSASWAVAGVVAAAVAGGAAWWFWWRPAQAPTPPVAASPAPEPAQTASSPAPVASGPQNPIDAKVDAEPLPPLAESDARVAKGLNDLLGAQKVASFLQIDGFVRRAVATVDNLPRAQAPSRMWPVRPAPERFTVEGPADAQTQTIAPANAARYRAFVAFAEAVPMEGAVKLYTQLYPLFQSAYEELGYPKAYFNDRLVAVLDHLRAAPEPAGPLRVQLTKVQGEVPSTRPWVRYEFADPKLESLSAGQKMLVRMGPENARRLKAVLGELRKRVATGDVARPAGQGASVAAP